MAPVQDDVEAGRAPALQHPLEHADLNKILPAGTPARSKMPLADEDAAAVSSALPRFAASHAGPDGGDFSMAGLAPSVRASGAGVSRQVTDSSESDPLLLRSRLVGEGELRRRAQSVRGSRGRNASNAVQQFYLRQNSHIEDLLRPLSAYVAEDAEATCANSFKVKIGIYGSITANVVLASLQLYAAASSASLSLIATCVDSVFDPFANLILNYLHRKSQKVDLRKWLSGGRRFETIGNIAYAFLMGSVSAIVIVESIRDLASHNGDDRGKLHIASLIAVGIAFIVKAALALYCFTLRKHSSQLEVLYEDHRNDLLINGLGIVTSALGSRIWFLDPLGAIVISSFILVAWGSTSVREFRLLAGVTAPPEILGLLAYKVMLYHEKIEKLDTVKAYSWGPGLIVEIDIVMRPETPLWMAHDVSQDLQDQIEELPMVERAHVHVDHESDHRPEHRKAV